MNESTFQGNGKVTYVPVIVNGKQAKQTNADRIRSMTDEELARFIALQRGWYCNFKDPTEDEYPKVIDWLRQESEGER